MAEYIERKAARALIKNFGKGAISDGRMELDAVDDIILLASAVECLPAAGVAPVVRCQECIHWMAEGGAGYKSLGTYRCPCARWSNDDGYTAYTDPDDFCSYGDTREEQDNEN